MRGEAADYLFRMNSYTRYAADDSFLMPLRAAEALRDKFFPADAEHGFSLEVTPAGPGQAKVFFYAEESGNEDELPEEARQALGAAVAAAGLPYLKIGYACTSDRCCAGSVGGGELRLYPDGVLAGPELVWSR